MNLLSDNILFHTEEPITKVIFLYENKGLQPLMGIRPIIKDTLCTWVCTTITIILVTHIIICPVTFTCLCVVHGTREKPYFEIRYLEVGKSEHSVGYSSFNLVKIFIKHNT